jgi:hypothetical protein
MRISLEKDDGFTVFRSGSGFIFAKTKFDNLDLIEDEHGATPTFRLWPTNSHNASFITLIVPSQHAAENSVEQSETITNAIKAGIAGESRITFKISKFGYDCNSVEDLLKILRISPVVSRIPSAGEDPSQMPTVIEAPYGIFLIPDPSSLLNNGEERTEFRFIFSSEEGEEICHASFALCTIDGESEKLNYDGVKWKLITSDIVKRGDYGPNISERRKCLPSVAQKSFLLDHLVISSMGSWIDFKAGIDPTSHQNKASDLQFWGHIARLGRDKYIKIVEIGYIFPKWYLCAIVQVFERKQAEGYAALVHTHEMLFPLQTRKTYQMDKDDRMPFEYGELLLQPTEISGKVSIPDTDNNAFWMQIKSADVLTDLQIPFKLYSKFKDEYAVSFNCPQIYIKSSVVGNKDIMNKVAYNFNQSRYSNILLNGQKVIYYQPNEGVSTESSINYQTESFNLSCHYDFDKSDVILSIESANIVIEQVRRLFPADPIESLYVNARYNGPNSIGSIFDEIDIKDWQLTTNDPTMYVCSPPKVMINTVSALIKEGSYYRGGDWPKKLLDKKLFGAIDLANLVDISIFPTLMETDDKVHYHWENRISPSPQDVVKIMSGQIVLDVTISLIPTDFGHSSFFLSIHNANVTVFDFFNLNGLNVTYHSETGQGNSISVKVDSIGFEGNDCLQFINDLASKLAFGDDSGFSLTPTSNKLQFKYSLKLPNASFGAFSIANMRLKTWVGLPFEDGPTIDYGFSFGEQTNPFLVSVCLLSGGGYIICDNQKLTLGIEAGLAAFVDLGIASGAAYIMAGVFYSGTELGGYIRCGGSLDVLGLITVSVVLFAELTYDVAENTLTASACVIVSIHLFVFTKDVTVGPMRYDIAGSRHSRLLSDRKIVKRRISEYIFPWNNYKNAFA